MKAFGMALTSILLFLATPEQVHARATIDLQFAICENPTGNQLQQKLGLKSKPKRQQVTYYDTATFTNARQGVFLKTKTTHQRRKSEVTLESDQEMENARCEIDRYGLDRKMKCSLEEEFADHAVWSKTQKAFAETRAPVAWDQLRAFGPFEQKKWRMEFEGYPASLEILFSPAHEEISEFSIKVPLEAEDTIYPSALNFLRDSKVRLCKKQIGKFQRLFNP